MGTGKFRIGHAGAAKHSRENNINKLFKRDSCSTGGFITSPTAGQTVDAGDDVMFGWDSACLNATGADIYLYAPYQASSLIQMFQNVAFSKGSYNATLKPKWWNSTTSVDLQLTIVETGSPAFLASLPPGPIWTVKYDASADNTDSDDVGTMSSSDANVTKVDDLKDGGGVSKGGIAAAVLVPLIVIGIGLALYIKFSRKREEKRRKRWSEAVDKRMSVISVDWRSMSTKGAEAAIRASMVDPNNRNSVWSASGNAGVGIPRPSSTFAVEGAGYDGEAGEPDMAQIRRTGVGLRGPVPSAAGSAGRISRVSFAADTRFSRSSTGEVVGSRARPSTDSRRTGVPSRAFHSAYIPPVPIPSRLSEYVPDVDTTPGSDMEDTNGGLMSPTQRTGALDLSAEDIRARMNGTEDQNEPRPSLDAVMPALTMMRTGNDSQADLLLERRSEQQPRGGTAPLHVETTNAAVPPPPAKSPIMDAMPMQPLASVMSPDEMLRAYAERRRTAGSNMTSPPGTPAPGGGIAFPMPVASPVSTTMRTLYSPAGATFVAVGGDSSASVSASANARAAVAGTGAGVVVPDTTTNPFRKSMARRDSQFGDEDAYFGAAR